MSRRVAPGGGINLWNDPAGDRRGQSEHHNPREKSFAERAHPARRRRAECRDSHTHSQQDEGNDVVGGRADIWSRDGGDRWRLLQKHKRQHFAFGVAGGSV